MKVARTLRRGSGLISMKQGSVRAAISRASFTRSLMPPFLARRAKKRKPGAMDLIGQRR